MICYSPVNVALPDKPNLDVHPSSASFAFIIGVGNRKKEVFDLPSHVELFPRCTPEDD